MALVIRDFDSTINGEINQTRMQVPVITTPHRVIVRILLVRGQFRLRNFYIDSYPLKKRKKPWGTHTATKGSHSIM